MCNMSIFFHIDNPVLFDSEDYKTFCRLRGDVPIARFEPGTGMNGLVRLGESIAPCGWTALRFPHRRGDFPKGCLALLETLLSTDG